MFEKEIEEYEHIRTEHQEKIADSMSREQWIEYNEILFSAHSCAIEGNSFTVDDTRILREQGMAMIPVGRSLLECTEMADHFRAFDYMVGHLHHPFDESLLKEVNRTGDGAHPCLSCTGSHCGRIHKRRHGSR